MATPYLSEIKIFSFEFAPKGWALCNGQLLAINQNQALFSLLGTIYGGDGRQTFALPNLQGKCGIHFGNNFTQGETAGEQAHTLNVNEMPAHAHTVSGSASTGSQPSPAGNFWAVDDADAVVYNVAASGTAPMSSAALSTVGGSQPHSNMAPYLILNFCIALLGIFPSRP